MRDLLTILSEAGLLIVMLAVCAGIILLADLLLN